MATVYMGRRFIFKRMRSVGTDAVGAANPITEPSAVARDPPDNYQEDVIAELLAKFDSKDPALPRWVLYRKSS
ncbi:MAG TPA: hypothetical protein VMS31_15825 [Pyrinomonadaceae bacterium]|nr:hypothetical protein [Pyrinomonadaceae bacterium]